LLTGYALRRAMGLPANDRSARRVPVRRAVTLDDVAACTVDISAGGICVEVDRPLPAGATVRGALHLEGRVIPFAGLVAWHRKIVDGARLGVRLTDVPADFAQLAGVV
jgi:hypothetical protein